MLPPCALEQPLDMSCPSSGIVQHQMQPNQEHKQDQSQQADFDINNNNMHRATLALTDQLYSYYCKSSLTVK